MSKPEPGPAGLLPRWVLWWGSVAIFLHFAAVGVGVLAAPSGPWPSFDGPNMGTPPQFAFTLQQKFTGYYLRAIKLTHNFHHATNQPGAPGVYLEIRLRDAAGQDLGTVTVPDKNANPWVRHRQQLLANGMRGDEPVMPPATEMIPAPHQTVREVTIWESGKNPREGYLKKIPEHLIPRNQGPVFRPSDWSMLLARSYARYLCREHGAESAEVIRYWQEPIPPAVLFMPSIQSGAFDKNTSNFGEFNR